MRAKAPHRQSSKDSPASKHLITSQMCKHFKTLRRLTESLTARDKIWRCIQQMSRQFEYKGQLALVQVPMQVTAHLVA